MAQYYLFKESIDHKVIGSHYPQCSGVLDGYDNEYENQYSLYRFAHQKGIEINYVPDLTAIKIFERTKVTDVISCGLGPGNDLVISPKFKSIITEFSSSKYQLFEATVNKKKEKFQYWWVHYIYDLEKFVDFKSSTFFHVKAELKEKADKIKNYQDYRKFYDEEDKLGFIKTTNTVLKHAPLDFFMVGQFNQTHYISQALKDRLVSENITGIEFELAEDIHFI